MEIVSQLQIKLLQNLVVFKQLTIPQFARLDDTSSEQTIRRALGKIFKRRKPLLKRVEFQKVSHFGKLSYVYSLSTYGVKRLEDKINDTIKEETFTPNSPRLTDDYLHRVSTIDFQIFMHLFSHTEDYIISKCFHYFVIKKINNSFYPSSKIFLTNGQSIIPDLVINLLKNGKDRWVMFELHNGNDKGRIKEQIKQHALCLTGLSAHRKYSIDFNRYYYILIVFEEETVMKAVINDISDDVWYKDVAQFFLCKSKDNLENTFLNGWTDLLGIERKINF